MGGALWLAGCAVAHAAGHHLSLSVYTVGTAVCAGWALAPDLDHPGSTVARSVGPVTRALAGGVGAFGAWVHARTRTRWDRVDLDGHRTVTHTAVWALLVGAVVTIVQRWGGPWVAAVLVFFASSLGIRAALPSAWRRVRVRTGFRLRWARGRLTRRFMGKRGRRYVNNCRRFPVSVPIGCASVLAFAAYRMTADDAWWLGLAVGLGSLIHCLGDCLTDSACPVLWPLPLGPAGRRRMWFALGPPAPMRFHAGGVVERHMVQPLLVVLAVGSVVWVVWPSLAAV